jgi:hypothetical protein
MTKSLQDKPSVRWGIKWKLIFIITILIVSLVSTLSYIQVSTQKKALEIELNSRIELMRENLIERAKSFIISLSQQVENDIAAFNFSGVMEAVNDNIKNNKEIKYAVLMDTSGKAILHTRRPNLMQTELTAARDREALKQKDLKVINYKEDNDKVIEIINPIQISAEPWGVLRLVFTLEILENEISVIRKQIQNEIKVMIYRSVLTSLGILGICLIVVFILSARITKPIIYLTESARKLSKC